MKKLSAKAFYRSVQHVFEKHGSEMLVGIGIAGMIGTTISAVFATPKAVTLIEEKKKELNKEKLTPVETVCTAGSVYIPSIVTGTLSIGCILASTRISAKRNAVLAAAYSLKDTALKEFKAATVETVGEKQTEAIQDTMARNRLEKSNYKSSDIIITGKGKSHFYDAVMDTPFESDIETVKSAINKINHRLMTEMYISVNELYFELNIRPKRLGDDLGWNIENGLIEPVFSAQLSEEGEPVIVIEYTVAPKYDYNKVY